MAAPGTASLIRNAWICEHKGCKAPNVPYRRFLQAGDKEPPECPEHGRTMIRQENG